jgi:hypothetical protein
MRALLADGIPTRRGVMAIHEEDSYDDARVDLPHTEADAGDADAAAVRRHVRRAGVRDRVGWQCT